MSCLTVLIAGAGPTGLVLALWLTRQGVAVRIVDKTEEPGTTSRAVAVQARTLEFYRQLGIAARLASSGVQIAAVNLWTSGRPAARLPIGRIGEGLSPYPYALIFPQDAHERLLIAELQQLGVRVERQTELLHFEQDSQEVRATLQTADGQRETFAAAYLAGCDGAHSTVRKTLEIGFPGGTYDGLFYVADVDATGKAANGEIHVDFEQNNFLAVFPLNLHGRLRLIGPISWQTDRDPRELTFEEVKRRTLANLQLHVSCVNWFSTYKVHHRVAAQFRVRRAFLLGDAAHVHSPVGGQGMNTGIGDAVNLAWKLAGVLQGKLSDEALDTYESERIHFARRLVSTTDRAFTFITQQGPLARSIRTRLFPVLASLLFRTGTVRRAMFRLVSQIGIRYRHSALSTGKVGRIRGGDRLPYVVIGESDSFAPLQSLNWQVHVYNTATAALETLCRERNLPLHMFPWSKEARRAGLARHAVYLVRPDGYVALVDRSQHGEAIRNYCDRWKIVLLASRVSGTQQ